MTARSTRVFLAAKWQNLWHSTNIYDSLTPLHNICKVMGIAPCTLVEENGRRRYATSKLGTVYSFSFLAAYTGLFVYANTYQDTLKIAETNSNSRVAHFIDAFQWFSTVSVVAALVLANCYHQKPLGEIVNQLDLIDFKIRSCGIKINYSSSKMVVTGLVTIQLIIFLIMEQINCSLFLKEMVFVSSVCRSVCYIPLILFALLKTQFLVLVMLLRQRFATINAKLMTLTARRLSLECCRNIHSVNFMKPHPSQHILVTVRRFHGQLCGIGCRINKAFALQILCLIGYNFISFTAHAYFCMESYVKIFIEGGIVDYGLATTTLWAFVKLGALLHITFTCSQTINEVRKTGVIIHKIKNRYHESILPEIVTFSKQIIHWNFRFTAFDLFDIDMPCFYAMVTSAATYLMILIQMDIAVNQSFAFSSSNSSFRTMG